MMQNYFKTLSDLAVKNAFCVIYSLVGKDENHFSLIIIDANSFCRNFSVDLAYASFLKACLDDFLKQGWLYLQNDKNVALTPAGKEILKDFTDDKLKREIEDLQRKNPNLQSYGSLLSLSCSHMADILAGNCTAQEIFFQDERILANIYGNNPIADALHGEMRNLFREAVSKHERGTLKILEIGAGTGATTKFLLPELEHLNRNQVDWNYTFSDISQHFVNEARSSGLFDSSRFNFTTLNLNKPSELKLKLEAYDIIIGTNVLHACTDVKGVLKNLRQFLKNSGRFIFGEITRIEAYLTYTFGLLKDWWQEKPQPYRLNNSPLLSIENWKESCLEVGLDIFKHNSPSTTPWQTAFSASEQEKTGPSSVDEALRKLQKVIADILVKPMDEISLDKTFAELGVDSILVLTFTGKVHQEFGIRLRAADIFDHPTIEKLAAYLRGKAKSSTVSEKSHKAPPTVIQSPIPFFKLQPYFKEHRYKGLGMMSVDGWIALISEFMKEQALLSHTVRNFYLLRPLFEERAEVNPALNRDLTMTFSSAVSMGEIYSQQNDNRTVYVEFELFRSSKTTPKYLEHSTNREVIVGEEILFGDEKMEIGEPYRTIQQASYSSTSFLCEFKQNRKLPSTILELQAYLHGLVTCALRFPCFALRDTRDFFLPSFVKEVFIGHGNGPIDHGIGILKEDLNQKYIFDLHLYNKNNEVLCALEGFQISPYESAGSAKNLEGDESPLFETSTCQGQNFLKHQFPVWKGDQSQNDNDIAVVGMSGVFGKAVDIGEFWNILERGECVVGKLPENRKEVFGDPSFSAAYLKDIDTFDHEFFHLSRQESQNMDPQQRLLLEQSYRAFEDAGITKQHLKEMKDSCGVFIGASGGDYLQYLISAKKELAAQAFWGNAPSVLSGRLSYYFDFHGPSITVDTACSSSLVALHLACQSIRTGECKSALVGGVFLLTTELFHQLAAKANMLSADGLCHTFDQQANGFVPGEAVVAVILKPLGEALKNRDKIYGVIKATGVNHDGRTNTLTAPSAKAQEKLIYDTYRFNHISSHDISYVEAHGTGTVLGDPIEVDGLSRAFLRLSDNRPHRCAIGSVKTTLGHSAAAAGLVGFVKILLAINHGKLPASLHYHQQNSEIDFDKFGFYVVDRLQDWPKTDKLRTAAVSSFGFGGTNAHAVIGENPRPSYPVKPLNTQFYWPILLSGHTPEILMQKAKDLHIFLDEVGETYSVESISYTLACRKDHFTYRFACVVKSILELKKKLSAFINITDQKTNGYFGFDHLFAKGIGVSRNFDLDKLSSSKAVTSHRTPNFSLNESSWKDVISDYLKGEDTYSVLESLFFDRDLVPLPYHPFQKFDHRPSNLVNFSASLTKGSLNKNDQDHAYTSISPKMWMFEQHALMDPGNQLLPGMCLAAFLYQKFSSRYSSFHIRNFEWKRIIRKGENSEIQLFESSNQFVVKTPANEEVARGNLEPSSSFSSQSTSPSFDQLLNRFQKSPSIDNFYEMCKQEGFFYGRDFQGIKAAWMEKDQSSVLAYYEVSKGLEEGWGKNTCVFDICLHPLILLNSDANTRIIQVPRAFESFEVFKQPSSSGYIHFKKIDTSSDLDHFSAQEIGIPSNFDPDKSGSSKAVTSHRTPNGDQGLSYEGQFFTKEGVIWGKMKNLRIAPSSFRKATEHPITSKSNDIKGQKNLLLQLKQVFARILQEDPSRLRQDVPFFTLGIDSSLMINILNEIEIIFHLKNLPKTLLYEYSTLESLAGFLVAQQAAAMVPNDHIQEAQVNKKHLPNANETIAIIGIYGAYGPNKGMSAYWETLKEGTDCVQPVSDKRLKLWGISREQAHGYVGSWIEDIDMFEPRTCRLTPRELEGMDPQERKFLDCVQGCLEEASYRPEALSPTNKVGVFVGVMYGHYELFGRENIHENSRIPNSSYASIANRVSHAMNWQGPSMAVDTMCSSSLTAIHLACASLRQGECEAAIAGGVNLHSHIQKYHWLKDTHFLSLNGRCRSFGQRPQGEKDGYIPGEGVGAVLLKPLSQAQKDGDYIWGVILGSALNHGGLANGYTVPTPAAQQNVIEEAIKQAEIDKAEISCIEAHGTGTSLGDPIEILALQEVFRSNPHPISIGSVKSNIGHLEAAAGMAGLAKILLQLHHRTLVPSLHSSPPNPYIDFSKTPFRIQEACQPWVPPHGQLLTAGLSAFGAGGSNAHIILQEYRKEVSVGENEEHKKPAYIFVWSSYTENDLLLTLQAFYQWWQEQTSLADNQNISWHRHMASLSHGLFQRKPASFRLAAVISSLRDLLEFLKQTIAFLKEDPKKTFHALKEQFNGYAYVETGCVSYEHALSNDDEEVSNLQQQFLDFNKYSKALDREDSYVKMLEKLARLFTKGDRYPDPWSSESNIVRKPIPRGVITGESYWVEYQKTSIPQLESYSEALVENKSNLQEVCYQINKRLLFGDDWKQSLSIKGILLASVIEAAFLYDTDAVSIDIKDHLVSGDSISTKGIYKIYFQHVQDNHYLYEVSQEGDDLSIIHAQGSLVFNRRQALDPDEVNPHVVLSPNQWEYSKNKWFYRFNTGRSLAAQALGTVAQFFADHHTGIESISSLHIKKPPASIISLSIERRDASIEEVKGYDGSQTLVFCGSFLKKENIDDDSLYCFKSTWKEIHHSHFPSSAPRFKPSLVLAKEHSSKNYESILSLNPYASPIQTHLFDKIDPDKSDILDISDYTTDDVTQDWDSWYVKINFIKELILRANGRPLRFLHIIKPNSFRGHLFKTLYKTLSAEYKNIHLISIESFEDFHNLPFNHPIFQTPEKQLSLLRQQGEFFQEGQERVLISKQQVSLDPNKTYLFVGGLGEIGQIVTDYAIERGLRKMILTGSRNLADLPDKERERRMAKIAEWQKQGISVSYQSVDLTGQAAVDAFIKHTQASTLIGGVFFLAGKQSSGAYSFVRKTYEDWKKVVEPKIIGLYHFYHALKDVKTVDFVLNFSSVSAAIPQLAVGLSDYGFANGYMDALTRMDQEKGSKKLFSIQWPAWLNTQLGNLQTKNSITLGNTHFVIGKIRNEQAFAVIDSVLTTFPEFPLCVLPQIDHSDGSSTNFPDKSSSFSRDFTPSHHLDSLFNRLEGIFRHELRLKSSHPLSLDTNFNDLGVDSILIADLMKKIESEFSITVPPTVIIANPTLRRLGQYLWKGYA